MRYHRERENAGVWYFRHNAQEATIMSSRIFQGVITQMKDAVDRTIGVVDDQGDRKSVV